MWSRLGLASFFVTPIIEVCVPDAEGKSVCVLAMTGALRCLSSVQPRLLHHAGASSDPQAAMGWLVGLPSEGGVIVTSILRSGVDFDKYAHLRQDIGNIGFC